MANDKKSKNCALSKRARRKERIREDLTRYGSEILNSDEMSKAFRQTHHSRATVGDHSMRVAKTSLRICYALDKLQIKTDIPAVVTGSLCHDLGIVGRDTKFSNQLECSRQHPVDSAEIAQNLIKDLPDKTADIIERHMWPIGNSKFPNSLEGVIVSAADKYAALKDLVQGGGERL